MADNRRYELQAHATQAERAAYRILDHAHIHYVKQYHVFTGRKHFYADIYIPSVRLIVEIDGGYHFTENQRRLDANRSACLRRMGYHVYRLRNADARDPQKLISKIRSLNASRLPRYITNNKTRKMSVDAVKIAKKRNCLHKPLRFV